MNTKQAKIFIQQFLGLDATLVRSGHKESLKNYNALFETSDVKRVRIDQVLSAAKAPFPQDTEIRRDVFCGDNILDIRFAGHQIIVTKYKGVNGLHVELIDRRAKRSVEFFERGLGLPLSKHSVTR